MASYLSALLFIDEKFAGSFNLYGEQPHSFGDLDESLLRLYTTAAAAISNARRYAEARGAADNLHRAMESRAVIDQAIGALMATRGLDADQAFQLLARESQNSNTKLREVAGRILAVACAPGSGRGDRGHDPHPLLRCGRVPSGRSGRQPGPAARKFGPVIPDPFVRRVFRLTGADQFVSVRSPWTTLAR